jgi:hypothetical protein
MSPFLRALPSVVTQLLTSLLVAGAAAAQLPDVLGDDVVANAGPDRFMVPPATSLALQGSIRGLKPAESTNPSVPSHVSIRWLQLAGPPCEILGSGSLAPTLVPSRAGTLTLRMKVITPSSVSTDDVVVYALGASQDALVEGELRKWHKLALTFTHDQVLSESGPVNPFLDVRLTGYFFNLEAGVSRVVPGFFAADGNAAESSATSGTRWRVNFTPDHAGTWYYVASFRTGPNVALELEPEAGVAFSFDGANGVLQVEPANPAAPGLLAKGRLDYVGGHHLRYVETGEAFLKGGAGSPENFFGYYEIDGTIDLGGAINGLNLVGSQDGLHHYAPHFNDYVDLGVPLWQGGKGRRIFGALSYLAGRGVNSLYAISFNTDEGDGQEVYPWVTPADKLRLDVSKLAQWERVLDHMNRAGIAWHVITQEFENDQALDGGELGVERKLYYRELVARFAWANGLVWNLGEENTNTVEQRKAFADYIRALDPWAHPIGIHNIVGDIPGTFGTLLGTHLEVLSVQGHVVNTPPRVRQLVLDSAAAGRPWVVNFDEQTPGNDGVFPDVVDFWHDEIRRESLWPMLLGQGGGCEWYFGYGHPNDDLDCEDFRSRDNLWVITRRAREFVRDTVPFDQMEHADALALGNDPSVLALRGAHYLVYLPFGGPLSLDLEGASEPFLVSWFDARNGGALQAGAVTQVVGPGLVALGAPPAAGDWVAWVRRTANLAPEIESLALEPRELMVGGDFAVRVHARDPNGPRDALTGTVEFVTPQGQTLAALPLTYRGGRLHSLLLSETAPVPPGTWNVRVEIRDTAGLVTSTTTSFDAQ